MHACGHDTHVAILMGVAEVLAGMRTNLPGSVKFIFQPAEEGAPPGEEGGAGLMIRKACWRTRHPRRFSGFMSFPPPWEPSTTVPAPSWRRLTGSTSRCGEADSRRRAVGRGRSHRGRLADRTRVADHPEPPDQCHQRSRGGDGGHDRGGNRGNIIPDSVVMQGTIRTFDEAMRADIKERIKRTVDLIAGSAGATATVDFGTGNNRQPRMTPH